MNGSPRRLPVPGGGATAVLAVAVALLAFVPRIRAQARAPAFPTDTDAFRIVLDQSGLRLLSAWSELARAPERTLLVLLGDPSDSFNRPLLDRIPGGLEDFIDSGGAVLIATDHHLDFAPLTALCGCTVDGGKVAGWMPWFRDPTFKAENVYRDTRECLVAIPRDGKGPPLFRDASPGHLKEDIRLVTNVPSYLRFRGGFRPAGATAVLADLPRGSVAEFGGGLFVLGRGGGPLPPFAVTCTYGDGRLLLLADHDVFTNQMMGPRDTGNVEFAFNAIDWLKGGRDQPRDRVLFVQDGLIRLPETPKSLADFQAELIGDGNRIAQWIEDNHRSDDFFLDKQLVEGINEGPGRYLFGRQNAQSTSLMLTLLAGLGLVVYGIYRLRRASHTVETGVPLFATAAARAAPSAAVLMQRHRAALQEDNLGEYAHLLAREWLNNVPEWTWPAAGSAADGHRPAVIARGGWWRRRSLRKLFTDVWRLAEAEAPAGLSQGEFRRLLRKLERLRAAVAVGDLRLEGASAAS